MKEWGVRRRGVCGLRRGLGAGRNEAWAWEDCGGWGWEGGVGRGSFQKFSPHPPKKNEDYG